MKRAIIAVIITAIVFGSLGVVVAGTYNAKKVSYIQNDIHGMLIMYKQH